MIGTYPTPFWCRRLTITLSKTVRHELFPSLSRPLGGYSVKFSRKSLGFPPENPKDTKPSIFEEFHGLWKQRIIFIKRHNWLTSCLLFLAVNLIVWDINIVRRLSTRTFSFLDMKLIEWRKALLPPILWQTQIRVYHDSNIGEEPETLF
jgi:hypothetical protein